MDDHEYASDQKALSYWGRYLFQPDKLPTPKLNRLLRGIAACLVLTAYPRSCKRDARLTLL